MCTFYGKVVGALSGDELTGISQAFPTQVPVYTLVLALLLPAIYMLPGGLIFAVTGQTVRIHPSSSADFVSRDVQRYNINPFSPVISCRSTFWHKLSPVPYYLVIPWPIWYASVIAMNTIVCLPLRNRCSNATALRPSILPKCLHRISNSDIISKSHPARHSWFSSLHPVFQFSRRLA